MPAVPNYPRSKSLVLIGCASIALVNAGPASHPLASGQAYERGSGPTSTDSIRYSRDIRPILSESCFLCHGPDISTREADLRLDTFEGATADLGGYAAIVPGDLENSELWFRLTTDMRDDAMPPHDSTMKVLTTSQKDLIGKWIEQGAEYEPHWAFETPVRPKLPRVKDAAWVGNELDTFLLARMEGAGLVPSERASKEVLLRRVFLDLTGLPPTPEELHEFLNDPRPDAYEQWVDKLLWEEPYVSRYAERMATPWLDAARYADTIGIHTDAGRQMWAWRDWVLRALRDNMPFDQFVVEQLAGDLIPDATLDQKVASGFHRNHVVTDEGGAIDEEYLVEYAADRTATTGAVFMGLTVHCSRCHDHKFDPVSQEEYYSLFSYFNSNEEPGLYSQLPDPRRAYEPFLTVPSAEQAVEQEFLESSLEQLRAKMATPSAEDASAFAAFLEQAQTQFGVQWSQTEVQAAQQSAGFPMQLLEDGSVLATGEVPAQEDHTITLHLEGTGQRLLLLEALQDSSHFENRVGRAANGNAVLSYIQAEAISINDPSKRESLHFQWAWADWEQLNGDYDVVNILDGSADRGWAMDAHNENGARHALLLTDQEFGFEGGTELRVTLFYRSEFPQHSLGRVRLTAGSINNAGLAALPVADSRWYGTWPYDPPKGEKGYDHVFGPEADSIIDFAKKYEPSSYSWVLVPQVHDGEVNNVLPQGQKVSFVGRRLFVPQVRKLDFSIGSDDGVQTFLDGVQVFENRVDRGAAKDQDRITLDLKPGLHTLILKIVNTGGTGGMYCEARPSDTELRDTLVWSLAPEHVRNVGASDLATRVSEDWRTRHSPAYREKLVKQSDLQDQLDTLMAAIPRTMVMKELEQPRETFVLMRGAYDLPDRDRPVSRGVPAALGVLPEDAPNNRLGLALWLTAPENPLLARVTVNRVWETMFGTGLVSTPADFGLQGAWPSHPELLDWLAVEFREGGWDMRALVRSIVTSETYLQSSRRHPEAAAVDPDNRLLSYYPRRRLGAEEIRDQALYISGLLVEEFGGPSVKPYQPEGLWKEVSMLASNTRDFERDEGDALWRRSLYTYWKRAVPPPSLLSFDAPTREFCVTSRSITNTPLQALVLWNDEQYVEAARVLAQRTLSEPLPRVEGVSGELDSNPLRIASMFLRCTGRTPEVEEMTSLHEALLSFEQRYREAPEDAAKLLEAGEAMLPEDYDPVTLAAWTLLANALLALDETITLR